MKDMILIINMMSKSEHSSKTYMLIKKIFPKETIEKTAAYTFYHSSCFYIFSKWILI